MSTSMCLHMHRLGIFGLEIEIRSDSKEADALILANYSALQVPGADVPAISYTAGKDSTGLTLLRNDAPDTAYWPGLDASDFLYTLETD
ncbi:MAG: hypothetical protein R3308_00845, partial [Thiohalobacterales bacterium]|nr:hypothetical protein [Thiohalobacterales bacterium]